MRAPIRLKLFNPEGISPQGIEGPKEPGNFGQINRKEPGANFGLDHDNLGQNCPSGIRTRAYKKIATYNAPPEGWCIWVPFRAPIIMGTP